MINNSIRAAMVLFVAYVVVTRSLGCASPQVKEDASISAYAAQQLRCVDKYDTRREIDACRSLVRKQWGIAETIKDAGADQ